MPTVDRKGGNDASRAGAANATELAPKAPAIASTLRTETVSTTGAIAKAQTIALKARSKPFAVEWREFFNELRSDASAKGYVISREREAGIVSLLSNPKLETDDYLRRETWREVNSLAIDLNDDMTSVEKRAFKWELANADSKEKMHEADAKWMEWVVKKYGSDWITGDGAEYFKFFADKLLKKDDRYLNQAWYWDYMFYMVNESARRSRASTRRARWDGEGGTAEEGTTT